MSEVRLSAKLQRAMSLSGCEWSLLLAAWVLLLVAELGLKTLPLRVLLKILPRTPVTAWRRLEAERIAEVVGMAARHHTLRRRCLRTAVVLRAILGARDGSILLVLGVAKPPQAFAAHALRRSSWKAASC